MAAYLDDFIDIVFLSLRLWCRWKGGFCSSEIDRWSIDMAKTTMNYITHWPPFKMCCPRANERKKKERSKGYPLSLLQLCFYKHSVFADMDSPRKRSIKMLIKITKMEKPEKNIPLFFSISISPFNLHYCCSFFPMWCYKIWVSARQKNIM